MPIPQQPDRAQDQLEQGEQVQRDKPREPQTLTRSVEIDAGVEQVWRALATDEGRQGWIEPDPTRVLIVDSEQAPERISWWWWSGEQPATHVALRVVEIPTGARVIVTETGPSNFPLAQLSAGFHRVPAFA